MSRKVSVLIMKLNYRTFKQSILLVITSFCINSCTSSVQVLKPEGDSAEITLLDQSTYIGELLSIADRSIIMVTEDKIVDIRISDIDKIHIDGYSLLQQKVSVLGSLSILDIYSLYSAPTSAMKVIFGLLAIGKLTSILGGDPVVVFMNPIFWKDLDKVRLHCRYPQGLDTEQWEQLLNSYRQSEFIKTRSANK